MTQADRARGRQAVCWGWGASILALIMMGCQERNSPGGAPAETAERSYELHCLGCHGKNGDGQGEAGKILNPSPRNFTNCKFHKKRKDGELFWVIKNGSAGTGMVSLIPAAINEEEAWTIINYERSFCKSE